MKKKWGNKQKINRESKFAPEKAGNNIGGDATGRKRKEGIAEHTIATFCTPGQCSVKGRPKHPEIDCAKERKQV